ncbi:molecular chaperone [Providencia rettgeri]|uniref:fimbrial biogenesis chaperone n=1 Tax=Providencia TaxID=586 RepID=UPI000BD5B50F|nr:molecular chaperone [Providencia sp. PROV156]MBW3106951.1 molecular chaperone [Providencia rettgeri]PCQ36273.1 fimbrial chaperone protein [Providencia rettgeri]BBU97798.1 type 1 fimbrial chaperone protein [Providencia rettgeri]
MIRLILTIILAWHFTLHAGGLSLGQSRVIFTDSDKNKVVSIRNEGESPLLIQMLLLDIKDEKNADSFIISPPLFKIKSKTEHAVRIYPDNVSKLPKDRESGFYLKARGIPPTSKNLEKGDTPEMVFVTAIIIKLYYRPNGIPEPNKNNFEQVKLKNKDGRWQFHNPTPYYMTIVDFNMNGKNYNDSILVSPFSYYKLENTNESINVASWRFLDDNGAGTEVFRIN